MRPPSCPFYRLPTRFNACRLGRLFGTLGLSLKCLVAPRAKQLPVRCFPDAFLPGASPWKRAFLGTLVALPLLLALLMTLALYFFQKQRRCQGKGQTGLGGGVCVRVVSRLARALLGRKCWRRKGHPGGSVARRRRAGVGLAEEWRALALTYAPLPSTFQKS